MLENIVVDASGGMRHTTNRLEKTNIPWNPFQGFVIVLLVYFVIDETELFISCKILNFYC